MTKSSYMHVNGKDMFIEVLKSYNIHSEYIKIKFRCWNIGRFSEPWLMTTQTFRAKIYKKDLKNWKRVNYVS